MKQFKILFTVTLISICGVLYSCKKDKQEKAQTFNNIKLSVIPDEAKASDTLKIQGYIMEQLSNKDVSSISIYVIKNSELYTSKQVLGKDPFKKLTSSSYINNELNVTSTGPKSYEEYNVQYNNYDFKTAIPLSKLNVASGDYLNVGFEIFNNDGTRSVQSARIEITD
jgi:hypothetical protein